VVAEEADKKEARVKSRNEDEEEEESSSSDSDDSEEETESESDDEGKSSQDVAKEKALQRIRVNFSQIFLSVMISCLVRLHLR